MNPLLSIVVPTKNRPTLIKQLIKGIDGTVPESIEYIIYDNSDSPSNLHIKQINQIRYYNDPAALSVGANFSKALSQARGHFIAFMGDDDEANHQELLLTLSRPRIDEYDAIISPIYDLIFHGGSGTRWTGHFDSTTRVKPNAIGRTALWGIHQISRLTRNFSYFWLLSPDLWAVPRGYFGVFKRELLTPVSNSETSREVYLSPDAYLMGRLSRARRTLYIAEQLFTPGTSVSSTSNLSNARQHVGRISTQRHFDQADLHALPNGLPDSFLPEVIWAASYLSATGKEYISPLHLAIIEQFVQRKYGIDIRQVEGIQSQPRNLVISICGTLLGGLSFITNRLLVAMLIMARYKFSIQQSYDGH